MLINRTTRALVLLAATALTGSVLAACSSSSNSSSSSASSCSPSTGNVNLTFTTWVPGIDKAVALWNKDNPTIQVKVQTGPNGNNGTYKNLFNQLKAGNAPDLAQVEYDALPSFRVQDGLTNIYSCAGVSDAKAKFVTSAWNNVTFGESNAAYAIPQDTGPMAMYYRKDLFDKAGLTAPKTWAEYAEDAVKIKALGGNITNFSQTDVNWFAGLVAEAGGQWFNNDGTNWHVSLTSDASKKVAAYWQDLISKNLVTKIPGFTDAWNKALNTGENWTWLSAVWGANSITSGAPDTSGKWAVAQLPQWTAGGTASANWGGSSTAVLKGSKHAYEASKFAVWLNTDPQALALLNQTGNLYPATTAGQAMSVFSQGVSFFGGQSIYNVFADASKNSTTSFVWGPTMTQTYSDVADGFGTALNGSGTLTDALTTGQAKTIAALQSQAIPVSTN